MARILPGQMDRFVLCLNLQVLHHMERPPLLIAFVQICLHFHRLLAVNLLFPQLGRLKLFCLLQMRSPVVGHQQLSMHRHFLRRPILRIHICLHLPHRDSPEVGHPMGYQQILVKACERLVVRHRRFRSRRCKINRHATWHVPPTRLFRMRELLL